MLTNGDDDFDIDELSPIQKQLSKIGKLGGARTKEKLGAEHYKTIGQQGGRKTALTRNAEFYAEIGRKGGLAKAARKKAQDDC